MDYQKLKTVISP